MAKINTPLATNALEDLYAGRTVEDAYDGLAIGYFQKICQAIFGPLEWMNEILALHKAKVATQQYYNLFACSAGLAVGTPVYASAVNTVAAANSTDATHARVIGFVRVKPTTTSCLISHFYNASGLAGLTVGSPVYLKDDGTLGATAGTVTRIVGTATSTTTAFCEADGLSSQVAAPVFDRTSAQQANGLFLFPETDLKALATQTLAIPTGGLIPQEAGIWLSNLGGTITTQPTISFGITGTNAKYRAAALTTDLSAVGQSEYYQSLLKKERETSMTFTVTVVAAGSSTIKGTPWFKGIPVV